MAYNPRHHEHSDTLLVAIIFLNLQAMEETKVHHILHICLSFLHLLSLRVMGERKVHYVLLKIDVLALYLTRLQHLLEFQLHRCLY